MKWLTGKNTPAVLIVEDDPVAALLLERMFHKHQVRVDKTDTAEAALQLHAQNSYRLIIADWVLPGMTGVELCTEIRKDSADFAYYIVCTSRGQRNDRLQAFEAGVDDFITKPIDREELEARLNVANRLILGRERLEEKTLELERAAQRLSDLNSSLQTASRRFEEMFNGLPVACFTFDQGGLIREWNRNASQSFGLKGHEVMERPVWEVFGGREGCIWTPELVERLFNGTAIEPYDWVLSRPEVGERTFAGNLICLRNATGTPVAAVSANIDITDRKAAKHRIEIFAEQLAQQKQELEHMNERLGHLAVTDGLTGLWNHRRFQEMLEDTVRFHAERDVPFSLILFDVDHFKTFNDEFGHQFGDQVLRQFADVLKNAARIGELPARYGGEEFAVLLQGCGEAEAMIAVERFMIAIRTQRWRHRPVAASLGVATCSDRSTTGAELIRQADTALYASKTNGRDRATHFNQLPEPRSKAA
jgi:two-component system cell cycle response regulator